MAAGTVAKIICILRIAAAVMLLLISVLGKSGRIAGEAEYGDSR